MRRRLALLAALAGGITLVGAAGAATPAPAKESGVQVAPVTRLPFPQRGYVVSVPEARALDANSVVVRENGLRVKGVRVDPLATSGLRYGVVLALDSSESMTGAPAAAALESARAFVAHREKTEEVGIVAFNTDISVLSAPTRNERALRRALAEAARDRLRHAHQRRADAGAEAAARGPALRRVDRPPLGRPGGRQRAPARRGARGRERAAGAGFHRRPSLTGIRRLDAARDLRPDRRLLHRGALGRGARADLREAERGARRRVPRSLPLRRPPDVAGRRADRRRRRGQGVGGVRRADAVTPGALPPLSGHDLPALGWIAADRRALLRGARVLAAAADLAAPEVDGRHPGAELLERVARTAPGQSGGGRRPPGCDAQPIRRRLVGAARARSRARADDDHAARGRGHLARVHVRDLHARPALLGADPRPVRADDAVHRPRPRPAEGQGRPRRVRGPVPGQPAGARVGAARRPQLQRRARRRRRQCPRAGQGRARARGAGRPPRRPARGRDPQARPADGQPRHRAGGAAGRAPAHVRRQLGRDPRHRRGDDPRAVGDPAAGADADGPGRMARWILTALPVFLTAFLWLVHPEVMANFFTSGGGQVALVLAAIMVAAGSVLIQKIVDIDV